MTSELTVSRANWKTQFLIGGAILGALLGAVTAYLLARTAEETRGGPPTITTIDAIKASIGVIGIVRSIASLGDGKK